MINLYNLSMFINKRLTVNIIVAVYINDLLIYNSFMNLIDQVLKHLQSKFKITDLKRIVNYLGIKIDVTADSITVYQYEYIQLVFKHFHINKCKLAVKNGC